YLAMVIAACVLNFHRALPLFVITVAAIFFVVWDHFMAKYEHRIDEFLSPGRRLLDSHWFWLKWVIWSSLVLGVIFWLIFDTAKLGQQQLVSFGGVIMYIMLLFLFSKHPTKVYWRLVFSGIGLQFLLGLLILRTESGFIAFDWLGKQVQVSSTHLLTASVMSAPAALAVAKLFWPETEAPKITLKNAMKMENGDSRNLLEAATQGASSSISLVASIAVNMIAFLALLSFLNSALSWFGNMFDYPQLSFELICSYIFMPLSFMMGVDWQDSFMVARLIASMTPSRKRDIASGAMRALISGTVACFMTACIAGMLSGTPVDINCLRILENAFNSSLPANTTNVVTCCQSLLSRTVAKGPGEVIPGGNHSLYSLKSCCQLLRPSTLNCSWISNAF
ncbi:PREDICTED: solute carrier family 28 member 3, partial [Hipposideros armiger]|uniref:Solute carrier family 28 member 3 n=1 Tax=Hipposideros armiger TaxID=186990 RepID=A0A8B7QB93_HIPAR